MAIALEDVADEAHRPVPRLEHFVAVLTRRRVQLSLFVFILLIGRDVLTGARPHDVTNFRDPLTIAGVCLVLLGLALRSWAVGVLHKDASLTTTGPYRLTRNPLYVGSFLMMFGFSALVGDPINAAVIGGPILIMYYFKVRQEEARLAGRFGVAWNDYFQSTPRFLLRPARTSRFADWSLGKWRRAREYRALSTSLLGLVALKLWFVTYGLVAANLHLALR